MKKSIALGALSLVLALGMSACRHEEPNVIYMPDMVYSPAYKAQKEGVMLAPVAGTIPRDYVPFAYAKDEEGASRDLKNPVRPVKDVLVRGQAVFNTYCIVCHGPAGEGDGYIVPKFPRPPSLQSDKIRAWTDGHLYWIVTAGRNLMPSYASQISTGDRWALIHYVRALQRSKHPSQEDLKAAQEASR
ncbi:MAG: c-type cytochrome [Bdellovibrionota bacterium]